jgi:predicted permease
MAGLVRDLAHAARRLRATPAFTLFAIVSLALGLGAATAVASIVRAVFSLPPGVGDRGGIVNVYNESPYGSGTAFGRVSFSWPDYQDLTAHQAALESVGGWTLFRQAFVANGHTEDAFGEIVCGDYFRLVGVRAEVGRALLPSDDRPEAPPVVVISHQLWQRVFGGAPDVVGGSVRMNGHRFTIVGVAPETFHGLAHSGIVQSAMWVPISAVPLLPPGGTSHTLDPQQRDRRWLFVKARLKAGRTLADAQAEIAVIGRRIEAAHPTPREGRAWTVLRATDIVINENVDRIIRPLATSLMIAVGLVLLVACTNLANLMLARGGARRQETAVRLALGASRWRLVRESLAESALVALAGGVLGLGVARALLVIIGTDLNVGPAAALHLEPAVDAVVAAGAGAATLLALAIAGLVPALQSTRADVRTELASGGSGGALMRWRGRRVLIATQVMVSLFLLVLASASIDVVRRDSANGTGLDLEHLAVARVDFELQGYDTARARQIVDAVLAQLDRRADVTAVAASSGLPIGLRTPGGMVRRLDGPPGAGVELMAATPGIFHTLGVAIIRGRGLNARDTEDAPRVVVLSANSAKRLFGDAEAVGRQVMVRRSPSTSRPSPPEAPATIVGLAADTDTVSAGQRDLGTAYVPLEQHDERRLVLSARTNGDPELLVSVLRRAVSSVDSELAVSESGTGVAVAAPSDLFLQVTAGIATLLGGFALILALAGLYGVLSHAVARRTREIGVRQALGATAYEIRRMVLLEGMRPVVAGIAIGLALGFAGRAVLPAVVVMRFLPAFNPVALIVAPLLMLLAAAAACYVPAHRASRVHPNVALRDL